MQVSEEIGFVINTWDDSGFCIDLINSIKRFYPTSKVVIICDGTRDDYLIQYCESNDVRIHLGSRLKNKTNNAWSERMFNVSLRLNIPIVVKIDPDCLLNNRLTFPDDFDISGRLYGKNKKRLIGPCIVFKRDAISKILKSESMKRDGFVYKHSRSCFGQTMHSQDMLLQSAIDEVGLIQKQLPDSEIDWICPPSDNKKSIVHPRIDSVKLIGWRCCYPKMGEGKSVGYDASKVDEYLAQIK